MLPISHAPSNHMHDSELDNLAHSSQSTLQHFRRHNDVHQTLPKDGNFVSKHRQHPYDSISGRKDGRAFAIKGGGASGLVRRRVNRACNQCNRLRTKCDGQNLCAHCVEFSLTCEYTRERKKRGKASRKNLAQQAAATTATTAAMNNGQKSPTEHSSDGRSPSESRPENGSFTRSSTCSDIRGPELRSSSLSGAVGLQKPLGRAEHRPSKASHAKSSGNLAELPHQHQHLPLLTGQPDNVTPQYQDFSSTAIGLNDYRSMHGFSTAMDIHMLNNGQSISYGTPSSLSGCGSLPYAMQSPPNYPITSQSIGVFKQGDGDLPRFTMNSPGHTPVLTSMQSPLTRYHMANHQNFNSPCQYPVLQPLIPYLGAIPMSLACDLVNLYFTSSSSAQMHPMSPYVLGYVFRQQSFLHPTNPRVCSPALLASMLWVTAETSDVAFLTAPPAARGRVCQRLLELAVGLVKPLNHGPPRGNTANFADTVINGVILGGVEEPMTVTVDANGSGERGTFGAAGGVDDIVTYIHLATVVSAGEYNVASLQWWNAAWSLARELKLGQELPPPQASTDIEANAAADENLDMLNTTTTTGNATEEEREERRRIWWLVYTVDRHLSLCYNKPPFLLDVECDGLLQPMDDSLWQAGEF